MWFLFVVDKCVLLTTNFVVFYFVKFCDIFLIKRGFTIKFWFPTHPKLKFITTTCNKPWQFLHRQKMTNFAQFRLQRFILAACVFQGQLILS